MDLKAWVLVLDFPFKSYLAGLPGTKVTHRLLWEGSAKANGCHWEG